MGDICFSCSMWDRSRGRDENGRIYCEAGRGWTDPTQRSCSGDFDAWTRDLLLDLP